MKTLVLDAMGVIYAAGDDVAELLCPFIHENGGIADDRRIEALYHDASGRLSAIQFWEQVQLDPALEDAYLIRHRLSAGLLQFLRNAKPQLASTGACPMTFPNGRESCGNASTFTASSTVS